VEGEGITLHNNVKILVVLKFIYQESLNIRDCDKPLRNIILWYRNLIESYQFNFMKPNTNPLKFGIVEEVKL